MNKCIVYAGLFLLFLLSGCTSDDLVSEQTDVYVTVHGESAYGTWQRDFAGPEANAHDFAAEAAEIVSAVARQFEGAIQVDISINDSPFETIVASGNDEQIVPAAIVAAHDIAALRTGFLPQGSIEELSGVASVAGQRPCVCKGTGCCCFGSNCANANLDCEGCGRNNEGYCLGGVMCWIANQENN